MAKQETTPGGFCWVELGTNALDAAKGFYGELFGWRSEEVPMEVPDCGPSVYLMLKNGEADVGGAYHLMPEQVEQGVPPNWLSYVAVADADATTEKARELGAAVLVEPMDVQDIGRMAVFMDPTGATFAIWQAKAHKGSTAYGSPGSPCWFELATTDLAAARSFYTALFGWKDMEMDMDGMTYVMLQNGEERAGGMMAMGPEHGEAPSHWMVYFAVENCDAALERVTNGGGSTLVPATDSPPGRFAVVRDSAGASFSVIQVDPNYGS